MNHPRRLLTDFKSDFDPPAGRHKSSDVFLSILGLAYMCLYVQQPSPNQDY